MNLPKLTWYSVEKDELPALAFGAPVSGKKQPWADPSPCSDMAGAVVGFAWEGVDSLDYRPPAIFVLDGKREAETLSWLRVYARDAFPLSQFARVLSLDDWRLIGEDDGVGRSFRDDRWASLILGELLAQSEPDVALEAVPIARAQACFSTPIARAHKFYESHAATRACTERLRAIEADSRFLRREIGVDSLVPIWSLASTSFGKIASARDVAEFVVSAASAFDVTGIDNGSKALVSFEQPIFSDSIEERVVEFNRIADQVALSTVKDGRASSLSSARIAAAAFLVGRGTSHAFMIRKYPQLAPLAQVWFGLIAGIAGAEYWDASWARALKAVEKHVRAGFSWSDPPMSDISWAEYKWVVGVVRGSQALSTISRQTQTSVSIELLPGVVCQLRMSPEESRAHSRSITKPESSQNSVVDPLSPELASLLAQIVQASDKARAILERASRTSPTSGREVSNDLFKGSASPPKRSPRRSKGK